MFAPLFAALAVLLAAAPASAQAALDQVPAGTFHLASLTTTGAGKAPTGVAAPVAGDPTALTITSATWTSSTDLAPVSQFVNGWTGDLTLNATTPAGATSAYAVGTQASPKLSFPITWPGYTSAAAATTGTSTVYATSWLRKTYNNETLPTEAANGGNAKIALSFNDFIYGSDVTGTATTLSGLYTSGAAVSTAKSGVAVTNASTRVYPRPIGVWVTPPGERIGSSSGMTVEMFGGQAHAQGGVPLAAVVITACDAGAVHCASKTVSTPTVSVRQVSTACTGTNGSAVLTACGDTSAMLLGMRFTVPGIPGQPRLLAKTSTTLTFGAAATCVTTLNSGAVTVNGTPVNGDGLADGAFVGATLTDANITTPAGVATINAATVTADVTNASSKATAAVVHTSATAVTAAAAHACTINHVYQGTTGAVTATAGNPVPVYAAVFTSGDFSTFTDGLIYFRAQAYPTRGDVVLDTQTGADGTRCAWFYPNVNGGVCNSSSAAWYNIAGTDITPNLHNLWAYLDKADNYKPAYVWVKPTGTCTTAACVSASATDPGGAVGNYAATIFQAQANLKLWYNTGGNVTATHNDAQGGVVCLTAGSYASMGGNLATATVANKPPLTVTSALAGGACPASGTANADVTGVTIATHATIASRTPSTGMRFNNLTFADPTVILQTGEGTLSTSFNTTFEVFNNSIFTTSSGTAILNKIGVWWIYNSFVDQSGGEGRVLQPASSTTGAMALLFGSTTVCGTFTTNKAQIWLYNALGNVGWACAVNAPSPLSTISTVIQPTSWVMGYNKWMGGLAVSAFPNRVDNFLMTHTVYELINSGTLPALQISGDSGNLPVSNLWRTYTTVAGARTNNAYLEGVPIKGTAVASGGTFAAATYYTLVTFSLVGNPTVETSTDGIQVTAGTFSGTSVVLNGSMNVELPCDPNYVANIHVGTTVTGAGSSATLANYGTVGGADGKQLAMCQTVVVTGVGGAHTSLSVAGSTSHNELKTGFIQRFNIDNNYNIKGDLFGGTTGQAGSVSSGGKVGNWESRFQVSNMGNIAVTGTVVGSGYAATSGLGEIAGYLDSVNPANSTADISWVKYRSDRSFGSGNGATPTSPALNLGQGDYHIDTSVTHPVGVVPTGYASWPWDVEGTARKSGATACAGAYEC